MTTLTMPDLQVTLGQPLQVTEGVGHCWFPNLIRFPGGELLLTHSMVADSEANLVTGTRVFVSTDRGKTWAFSYDIAQGPNLCVARRDGAMAGPMFHQYGDPPGQARRFSSHYFSYEDGGRRFVMLPWGAHVEGLPRDVRPSRYSGKYSRRWMSQLYFDGDVVQMDGRALGTAYVVFEGEERYACLLLVSEDEGRTWRYVSTIATPNDVSDAKEGPDEASLIQLADGDLMCVMRVGSGRDQRLARVYSADGGKTWSKVDRLPAFSVEPSLLRMGNGTLALSTGRPGIYLWLSTDPRGQSWQAVDILAHHNRVMGREHHIQPRIPGVMADDAPDQTTAYTQIVDVAPDELLLAYDRTPFGWKPTPPDGDERSRIYVLAIRIERT